MAVLLVVQVAAIAWAKSLALGPERTGLVRFHKSLGVTIFVLALVRVLARAAVRAPGLPPGMPAWERLAARASHACLYLLLFLLPLSGWLMSGAGGRPVSWFGWITIPSPVAESPGVRDFLVALHVALAVLLGTVLLAHVAAALRHHFVLRDDVLQRMLGSRRTRGDG
jgi:cytochrome b561